MIKLYFWVNAALYVLFALWCTFRKEQTAEASGYIGLNSSGWSEYLVIYGGLQLGLAGFFVYLATHPEYDKVGLVFALLLYVGIVLYRLVSVFAYWPVKTPTLVIAGMEVALLLGAVFCWLALRDQV